jgi:hypothetical protein
MIINLDQKLIINCVINYDHKSGSKLIINLDQKQIINLDQKQIINLDQKQIINLDQL